VKWGAGDVVRASCRLSKEWRLGLRRKSGSYRARQTSPVPGGTQSRPRLFAVLWLWKLEHQSLLMR
jgi:hypothetical protein